LRAHIHRDSTVDVGVCMLVIVVHQGGLRDLDSTLSAIHSSRHYYDNARCSGGNGM
jgi:hypothetical protein